MDKYGLSNETRAAEDDSSALYHMLLCGSGVAVGGEGGRGGGVEGVVVHEEALKPQRELSQSWLTFSHNGCVL